MKEINDEKRIRKLYGEQMWHLCRNLFPTLLENPGLLTTLLEKKFHASRSLYQDIIDQRAEESFKNYIYSLTNVTNHKVVKDTDKSVKELLDEAGYVLYECKSESDIQSFKHYYAEREVICSITEKGRLSRCYVFFAVKKDIDNIRREDFLIPHREDEYGTSLISIQFTKGKVNTVSIKNRYNHHVDNPDATFHNDLENIIPGLTRAFENDYNLNIDPDSINDFVLDNYVRSNNGKYYKYNHYINNVYYCEDNIIIDHGVVIDKFQEREKYIVLDYFILDLVNKKIFTYEAIKDSFMDDLQHITKIEVQKHNQSKTILLTLEGNRTAQIDLDKCNRIISYKNDNIRKVKTRFLYYNEVLENIDIPNAEEIDNYFLYNNKYLQSLYLPKTRYIGSNFLRYNLILSSIELPQVMEIDNDFLGDNNGLKSLMLPNVRRIYGNFLYKNIVLEQIELPVVEEIGSDFLSHNKCLKRVYLPNVTMIRNQFLERHFGNLKILTPKLEVLGYSCLKRHPILKGKLKLRAMKNAFKSGPDKKGIQR